MKYTSFVLAIILLSSCDPINSPTEPDVDIMTQCITSTADLNKDGVVDDLDLDIFGAAYVDYLEGRVWNREADLNCDGKIDIEDAAILGDSLPVEW